MFLSKLRWFKPCTIGPSSTLNNQATPSALEITKDIEITMMNAREARFRRDAISREISLVNIGI